MPQPRPGLTDSGLSHHALCPTNSPDSKRKAARQTQRRLTGQYLENPIQSLGEMGLEQNLKQPVAANWGAAAQRKASRLWSASTARWKRWSLGLKKKKGGGERNPFTLVSSSQDPLNCSKLKVMSICFLNRT